MMLEQKLEETHEELQRVTEAESSLRSRCDSLEDKWRQRKDQVKLAPTDIIHFLCKQVQHLSSKADKTQSASTICLSFPICTILLSLYYPLSVRQ